MIDINNSQDFDAETFADELAEEQQKLRSNPLTGSLYSGGLGGLGTLAGVGPLSGYAAVLDRAKRELTDPIEFLKTYYPGQKVWRFILTHPDLDHMRGLKALYDHIGIDNFWDTDHTKTTPTFRSDADKEDWRFYQTLRGGSLGTYARKYTRGDSYYAFSKEQDGRPGGDSLEILSPTPQLVGACNTAETSNDLSIVIRVHHAGRSVLLPGDAEELAWDNMCEFYGARLKSSFMKASHHGRDSGYHLKALQFIDPIMVFVSCGRKPDTDASYKYRQQTEAKVPSTRYYGNIDLKLHDDGDWSWSVQWNADKS